MDENAPKKSRFQFDMHRFDLDKISLWLIGIIGFFVVFGGILQIRSQLFAVQNNVFRPVQKELAEQYQNQADSYLANNTGQELADLQTADTDSDGLSDFDELYLHNTSPYLADTDSDGIGDLEEISAGTDPNCPDGEECIQARIEGTPGSDLTDAERAFATLGEQQSLPVKEDGTPDTEKMRATLLQYGVPQDTLNQISDEELLVAYQEAVGQVTSGANGVANIDEQASQLLNLSIEEKKQYLLEAGITQEQLNGLDDETIGIVFEDAVNQAISSAKSDNGSSTNTNTETTQNTQGTE